MAANTSTSSNSNSQQLTSNGNQAATQPMRSYVDQDGEWKNRKITIMGVVRSFVSQLRPGQDLTRVSLPAVLLYPYSMLEVFGSREISAFETLCNINKEEDPQERMMWVLRWMLSTIQQETFHKKPYNPLLGETHTCWSESPKFGRTDFIAEQVSHHPPVSAVYVKNAQEEITLSCNLSFGVKFGGNHVSIVTEGAAVLNCERFKEQYEVAKRTPDMTVRNVIIGTKRIYWTGDVSITCPKTGYSAFLQFTESHGENVVQGTVMKQNQQMVDEVIWNLKGKCGHEIYLINPKNSNDKKLMFDAGALKKIQVQYLPRNEMDPLESMAVWSEVSRNIIDNDMEKADEAKKKIEQEQRERIAARKQSNTEHEAKYFTETEYGWVLKDLEKGATKSSKTLLLDSDESEDSDSESETIDPEEEEVPPPRIVEKQPKSDSERHHRSDKKSRRHSLNLKEEAKKLNGSTSLKDDENRRHSLTLSASRERERDEDHKKDEISRKHIRDDSRSGSDKEHDDIRRPKSRERDLSPTSKLSYDSSSDKEKSKKKKEETIRLPTPEIRSDSKNKLKLTTQPSENIMSGWMKMRNSMKLWINRFFVLRAGMLIYYKDDKVMLKDRCAGILRLADCRVKERPTNKDGFCFKIYHLLRYPIYHKYGLRGETLKLALLPVSWNYCILRVSSDHERKAWMDAINAQIEAAKSSESEIHGESEQKMHRADSFDNFSPSDEEEPAIIKQAAFTAPIVEERELAETLFKNDSSSDAVQKNLVHELGLHQKEIVKSMQKKTLQIVEEWKQEMESRINSVEKKLMLAINKTQQNHTPVKKSNSVTLSYFQLFGVLVLWFLLSRWIY